MTEYESAECCQHTCDCCWKYKNLTELHHALLAHTGEVTGLVHRQNRAIDDLATLVHTGNRDLADAVTLIDFWHGRSERWEARCGLLVVLAVVLTVAAAAGWVYIGIR